MAVRLANHDDVDAVAAVLAAAYVDDPWVAWLVAEDDRPQRVRALQSRLLAVVGVPHGEVWLSEEEDGSVSGGALWLLAGHPVPPEAWATVATTEAELMGDRYPYAPAAATATRHLRPTHPHHLLASLGVRPDQRGRGIGPAILQPVLGRADRDGVGAYLETSAQENLSFYGRLGFTVSGHVVIADGGPDVWAMFRQPA